MVPNKNAIKEETNDSFRIRSTVISKPIAYTYVLSILYNVVFFMQLVSSPYLIKSIGISDAENGMIQTVFGILQMIGGPLFGYCIQKFGIRFSLLLCYSSTLVSGVLLLFSYDLKTLLLSRIPALFMHGQQSHQTLLSALTEPGKQRTTAFGRMGLTFGIGFIFTPIFNIVSTKLISDRGPFLVSSLLCFVPMVVLEKLISKERYETSSENKESESHMVMNISNTLQILKKPGTLNVLIKKNLPIIPALLIFAVMNLYMINQFNLSQDYNHFLQLVIGIFIMFSNGFGVIWLRKKFTENTMLFIGTSSFLIGYFLFHFFTSLSMFFFIMPFLSMGMSVQATVSDSMLTALVEEREQGLILGISTSFNSLVRTLAPGLAGFVLETYGFNMLATFGMTCCCACLLVLQMHPLDTSLLRKPKTHEE